MKARELFGGSWGYTIVEVLIFLAVSGALLVAAMTMISGRQEKTRFNQSIDEMGQVLEDVFNDVATGYYPSNNNLACTDSPALSITNSATTEKGTNSGCVFSGKLISFTNNSADYKVYTVVSTAKTNSFVGGTHKLAGIGANAGVVDSRQNNADVNVSKVVEKAGGIKIAEYNSLMFMSDFDAVSSSSGNATNVRLYGYNGSINDANLSTASSDVKQISGDSEIIICLQQGSSTDKVGMINITTDLRVERTIGSRDAVCTS